jgi:hypothetical protein
VNTTTRVIDKEAIKQKYLEERDKRLHPDGNDQYIRIENQLSHYLDDPYVPVKDPSTPLRDCRLVEIDENDNGMDKLRPGSRATGGALSI